MASDYADWPWHISLMMRSFFDGVSLRDQAIAGGIIFLPFATLVILAAIFMRAEPIDPRVIWGCYVADGAPALSVEPNKIQILDGTHRSLSYAAEFKRTYVLTVQPALRLSSSKDGQYSFVEGRGSGYFWDLLAVGSDNPTSVRSPQDFGGRIGLVTTESTTVIYVRSESGSHCR
ncbi:MAG: hypothetical protein EOP63_06140 [Sphingomonadales bacterium]|nr:MAG: hypothetical protein EOP63_06140 [Sphingomonadales bacterium]